MSMPNMPADVPAAVQAIYRMCPRELGTLVAYIDMLAKKQAMFTLFCPPQERERAAGEAAALIRLAETLQKMLS